MNEPTTPVRAMRDLIRTLQQADIAYYRDDAPILSDHEYDKLYEQLQQLEQQTGLILSGSPTQKVSGAVLDSLTEVRHTRPMLSAAKTKSVDDLVRFAQGHAVLLSWKMDGLTLVLRYDHGELQQAITRGRDGIIGEDVTHTVRTFDNVPLRIPMQSPLEVRGEGVISWQNFRQINADLDEPYSHPRNLAAGSTRKLDASESKKRHLEFWAFDLISRDVEGVSKLAQQQLLLENGFNVVPYHYLDAACDGDALRRAISTMDPQQFDYPVDGLILEYDDVRYGASLGATGHHENRLIALKWEDEEYTTTFRGVELATTRTGMVSLTAMFDPIPIDGTVISRAYLHNLNRLEELQLGVGDKITIYKANRIIPQIADNLTRSGSLQLAQHCPCCGRMLVTNTSAGGTRQLYCPNGRCASRLVNKFVHFCEKDRMNIEGLSANTLEKLISHNWIRTYGDLYTLEQHRDEIVRTDGFGERSFERMQEAIEKSRHCTLAKFIAAMGIPMVGRHAGRDLDKAFCGSWEVLEQAIKTGFDFTVLPNFGPIMQNNLYAWYADEEEAKLWRPLLNHLIFEKENETMNTNQNNPFTGKNVCATGKLQHYTRDGIQNKLLELGAKPTSSVTKKTDFLIVGEKAGSKLDRATALGVRTLTEDEFEAMLA